MSPPYRDSRFDIGKRVTTPNWFGDGMDGDGYGNNGRSQHPQMPVGR